MTFSAAQYLSKNPNTEIIYHTVNESKINHSICFYVHDGIKLHDVTAEIANTLETLKLQGVKVEPSYLGFKQIISSYYELDNPAKYAMKVFFNRIGLNDHKPNLYHML